MGRLRPPPSARNLAAYLRALHKVKRRFNGAPPVPDIRRHRIGEAQSLSRKPEETPPPTFRLLIDAKDQGDLAEFISDPEGDQEYLLSISAPSMPIHVLAHYDERIRPRLMIFWGGTMTGLQDKIRQLRREKPRLLALSDPDADAARLH